MKEKFGGTTVINLNLLRDQGYMVSVIDAGAHEHGELHITPRNSIAGTVLKDEISANLEMTIGVKKTNKIQKNAVEMINRTILFECIKNATK